MFYAKCYTCDNMMEYPYKKTANAAIRHKRRCKECRRKTTEERRKQVYRICSDCNNKIYYPNRYALRRAENLNQVCQACSGVRQRGKFYSGFERECPSCKKILTYKSSDNCTRANKLNDLCKSCSLKAKGIRPSKECIEKMLKANTGRIHSEEEKKKRANTLLKKYGKTSFLQSKEYKIRMSESGKISLIHGKTPLAWANEYNLPPTAIYKWLELNSDPTKEEILSFCENYEVKISSLENFIQEKLNINFFNKKCNDELEYRPDFKLSDNVYLNADGLYWHSEKICNDKWYHFRMRKDYEKVGFRLLQFREDEIYNKFNIVNSIISNAMGNIKNKIGARKTLVKEVASAEAMSFLENNHIKGFKKAKHIGLYYNNELISIMSYKFFKKNNTIKIERFCSKVDYSIMGGFSKLLKYISSNFKKNTIIEYWVDLRYGTGNFLLNQGFKLEKETLGWEWTDFKTTYNRLQCRANMDERGLSEKEHAEELGWVKIYDAGQRLYSKVI